jgi:hypothetical protein
MRRKKIAMGRNKGDSRKKKQKVERARVLSD